MRGDRTLRMAPRTLRAVAMCVVVAANSFSCQRLSRITYRVGPDPADTSAVRVSLELNPLPRDSLVLGALVPTEVMRANQVRALFPGGRTRTFESSVESVMVRGKLMTLPRYVLRGRLPPGLTVSYRVHPGLRQGNEHMGFTGRRFGLIGRDFCFATGRQLFLLPKTASAIRDARVRFSLPPGWRAVTPWNQRRGYWSTAVRGGYAAEHLIAATVGWGKFGRRSFRMGRTSVEISCPASVSDLEANELRRRLQACAGYVRTVFGRDVGSTYRVLALPESPEGGEIVGEAWGDGQGRTLVPLTAARLHGFAQDLVSAYVRHPPYRSPIAKPEEFWLVDAVEEVYAWRAVARVGLASEEDLSRQIELQYADALATRSWSRNLEALYEKPASQEIASKVLAPFVLLLLERELRRFSPQSQPLDAVVRSVFGRTPAVSIWRALPRHRSASWAVFRNRYVRGRGVVPPGSLLALEPTQARPLRQAMPVVRNLTLILSGRTHGYLENCGCKVNQSGGVARRAHVIRTIRASDPNVILLDAGSAFSEPEKQTNPDFLSREEERLYFGLMGGLRYDAAAIGTTELATGLQHFREVAAGCSVPFVSSNVTENGVALARPMIRLVRGDIRVVVIGLFEPPQGSENASLERAAAYVTIEDPERTLSRLLPSVRPTADLVIALGRLSPGKVRSLIERHPELDLVVSTEFEAPTLKRETNRLSLERQDRPGFIGNTLVLYTLSQTYGVEVARLGLNRRGAIAAAEMQSVWLRSSVPDNPEVRESLNRFYDRVGRMQAAQSSVRPLFAQDRTRMTERYVGAGACRACHEPEFAQWSTTKHASAYKTLLDVHRHYQPRCVVCHVVGLGTRNGYRIGQAEGTLANVQCEICHGPGGRHAEAPSSENISSSVPVGVCVECHNPEHSDHFVYDQELPRVKHDYVQHIASVK